MSNYKRQAGEYRRPAGRINLATEPGLQQDRPSYVVGTTFHQSPLRHAARSRSNPIEVELVPEPGNPHDSRAVAVDVDGVRCGYLKGFVAARWHDIVRLYNRRGRAVVTPGEIERHDDGYAMHVQLPLWGSWEDLIYDLGLDTEADATVEALPDEVRQRCLRGAWDGIAEADVEQLRRLAHLHPSLTWSTARGLDADDRIPEILRYRLREMLLDAREEAREERAARARERKAERDELARQRQQRREEEARRREERRATALALWQDGHSKAEIGRRLEISEATVSKLLREAGAEERETVNAVNEESRTARRDRARQALALQRAGHARKEIAARMALSMDSVKELLSDAKFYEDPTSVPDRLDLAGACARDRANGLTKAQMISGHGVSPAAVTRALRDADALGVALIG